MADVVTIVVQGWSRKVVGATISTALGVALWRRTGRAAGFESATSRARCGNSARRQTVTFTGEACPRGDREGEHSIRVNDQYRITFRFEKDGNAYDVACEDYH